MRHRDFSLTVALCLSLAFHAAIIRWRAEAYANTFGLPRFPGFDRVMVEQAMLAQAEPVDVGALGDDKGVGRATDPSPGDVELLARKGEQEQSYLSHDPQSLGVRGGQSTPSLQPPGEDGANGAKAATDASAAASNQHPFGLEPTEQQEPTFKPKAVALADSGPAASLKDPPRNAHLASQQPQQAQTPSPPAESAVMAYRAPAGKPGPVVASANNPAPQGESDSDPFTFAGSVEFRPGSTRVQCGRKHRITRPRLSWDTAYDLIGMTSSAVTLELQLDETGQVISATIIQSSGSQSIDQPTRLAAYSWWFEPAKDASGKPTKDVIRFTVKYL
jgi:TonB family protein